MNHVLRTLIIFLLKFERKNLVLLDDLFEQKAFLGYNEITVEE